MTVVNGRLRILNQTTPADNIFFTNLSPDLINILGFGPENFIFGTYNLTAANNRTSPGLLNLNASNSYYFLECDQVFGGYNNRGTS